jgi:hypothetical protein
LAVVVLAGVPFGKRDWTRGSFRKRFVMWALARMGSSDWISLAGCMALRYARHKPSMVDRESWFRGRSF